MTAWQKDYLKIHQLHCFFFGCPVLVAPVNGYVINSRQDPGYSHLAVLSLIQHLLSENVSLCPQTVLLPRKFQQNIFLQNHNHFYF